MNVLIYASSASHQLSNALRSILSPFYTVQPITPVSLATQPWTASCALLVLPPPDGPPVPLSLPKPAHEAIQEYITAGGRILGIGLGVSFLSHRPGLDRFDLWDARSGTAIVPELPQGVSTDSPLSSVSLQMGTSLSGLRQAGVSFELSRSASTNEVIRGRWEEPTGAVAGIQVPVGFGHAAFWGISPYLDGIEDTASVLALFRYALTSLGLSVPPETTLDGPLGPLVQPPIIPRHPLPQLLLHPRGKRHIADAVLRGLGLSAATADSESSGDSVGVIKDDADTFHFHRVAAFEHAARLVAEAKRTSTDTSSSHVAMAMDAPRVVLVLPPDVLPTEELTPRFDVEKYFNALADVRRDQTSDTDNWGMGEALFYGEAVTSTQTMLDRYATHTCLPPVPQTSCPRPKSQKSALPGGAPHTDRLPRDVPARRAWAWLQYVALATGLPAVLNPRPRASASIGVGAPRASPRLCAVPRRAGRRSRVPRRARAGCRTGCARAAQVAQRRVRRFARGGGWREEKGRRYFGQCEFLGRERERCRRCVAFSIVPRIRQRTVSLNFNFFLRRSGRVRNRR
jgi:biotin---protein ligase